MKLPSIVSVDVTQRNDIVMAHQHLIRPIACLVKRKVPESIGLDDLEQTGMLGLIEAAGRFDPYQAGSFVSYARLRIRGAMLDWVSQIYQDERNVTFEADQHDRVEHRAAMEDRLLELDRLVVLKSAMRLLSPKEERVMRHAIFYHLSSKESAREIGCTVASCNEVRKKATAVLRGKVQQVFVGRAA